MEVIQLGTPPKEIEYDVQCRRCNSVLRFKQSEAKVTYDPREGDYMTVMCPVCMAPVEKSLR